MGARDLLNDLASAGISVTVEGDWLVIRPATRLTDDLRAALRKAKPELLAILTKRTRPYALDRAEADAAHAKSWDDPAIARFVARVSRLMRIGFHPTDADDLAERLHLLDVRADGRVSCINCAHLSGAETSGWRCHNQGAAGVAHELATEIVTLSQRCPGWNALESEP